MKTLYPCHVFVSPRSGTGIEPGNEPPEYAFAQATDTNPKANAIARVPGRSMEPLFHKGDLLYIHFTDYADDSEDTASYTEDSLVV